MPLHACVLWIPDYSDRREEREEGAHRPQQQHEQIGKRSRPPSAPPRFCASVRSWAPEFYTFYKAEENPDSASATASRLFSTQRFSALIRSVTFGSVQSMLGCECCGCTLGDKTQKPSEKVSRIHNVCVIVLKSIMP